MRFSMQAKIHLTAFSDTEVSFVSYSIIWKFRDITLRLSLGVQSELGGKYIGKRYLFLLMNESTLWDLLMAQNIFAWIRI